MPCIRTWGFGVASVVMLLLPLGCPPPSPLPPCTEADLSDLRYEESAVGGDAGRIVFERAGYPRSYCIPPRNGTIFVLPPVERTWVLVEMPGLTCVTVSPPFLGPTLEIVTDGHWATVADREYDVLMLRDLDTGSEQVVLEGINAPYRFVSAVARPYVLLQGSDEDDGIVLNVETGVSCRISSTLSPSAVSAHFAVYAQFVNPGNWHDFTERLTLLNLDTGQETVIKEAVPTYEQVNILESRVVWVEDTESFRTHTVQIYDLESGTTSSLVDIDRVSNDLQDNAEVCAVGEAGVIVRRWSFFNPPSAFETVELVGYDGSSTPIVTLDLLADPISGAVFAGPYVVYYKEGRWIIYDPADGSKRHIDPFSESSTSPEVTGG